RSRAYINGRPSPVGQLSALASHLVDIHGQHAHQALLRAEQQRALLDGFAGHAELVEAVGRAHRAWRESRDALRSLSGKGGDRQAEVELLRYQLRELEQLAPGPGECEALEQELTRLEHLSRIVNTALQGLILLQDQEGSALDRLARVKADLTPLTAYEPALTEVTELLESAAIQAGEAAASLQRYTERTELDPERLRQVEQRLEALHDVARKHRVRPEELPELQQSLAGRLTELESGEERARELEQALSLALERYREAAMQLSASRREAAERLGEAVTLQMQELGLEGARFTVQVETADEGPPTAAGRDRVTFLFSANPGQPLRPLASVASGGELSRVSLCLQVTAAGYRGVPTLVFDEVDVGIGGRVAEIVGRLLRRLGEQRQVLCVTHLPQVAAQGHHHVVVEKAAHAGEVTTRLRPLEEAQREAELARMLGGVKVGAQARAHARELLRAASAQDPSSPIGST
ncbi:MAG: DNA repair protein RecN, partial [Gammaproteobacteria bacterium]